MRRIGIFIAAIALAMVFSTAGALACTNVYVGKDASKEGTTIIARSEDQLASPYNKMFKVQPRVEKAGRIFTDTGTGNEFKLPELTYKYTYVPDSSDAGDGMYPACCTNEYGVAVIGTVTTEVSEEYMQQDPIVETGLREAVLPAMIACQSKTARDAVDVLAELIKEYGSAEYNTLMITDPDEGWFVEIYGGKTYCAMKMPSDCVAVHGNQNMIGVVDDQDTENYVFAPELFNCIEAAGNVVKEDGKYNLVKSITGFRNEFANSRTWRGHMLLSPSTLKQDESEGSGIGEWLSNVFGNDDEQAFDNETYYPLFYKPDEKVSVADVMNIYRDRYEGTDMDVSDHEDPAIRPIGTNCSSDVHIVQTMSDLPKDSCQLQWLSMGNAEHSIFVPSFSGITDTLDAYKVDGTAVQNDSAYWMFKRNCVLAEQDRAGLSAGAKEFCQDCEKDEIARIEKQKKAIQAAYAQGKQVGRDYVTKLAKKEAQRQLRNSDVLHRSLLYAAAMNSSDTAPYMLDDEVHDVKVEFAKPVAFQDAAESAGYEVKAKGKKIILSKDDVDCTLTVGSTSVYIDGEYANDMSYPIYKEGNVVYGPADFSDSMCVPEE